MVNASCLNVHAVSWPHSLNLLFLRCRRGYRDLMI